MIYNEYIFFLIQRGQFVEIKYEEITGLDSIISFDYMGAAEYEFGSLPKSLKRIVGYYRKNKFICNRVTILNKSFVLYVPKEFQPEVINICNVMESIAKNEHKYSVKMSSHFDEYFNGEYIKHLKKGCKKKTELVKNYCYCNFWWDIHFDWFLFPDEKDYATKIEIALSKLVERKFNEL